MIARVGNSPAVIRTNATPLAHYAPQKLKKKMLVTVKPLLTRVAFRSLGFMSLPLARAVGGAIGRLMYLIGDRGTKVTKRNLALCFPALSPKELEKLARASMVETAKLAFEMCVVWQRDGVWLRKAIVRIRGEALVQAAVEKNKGVIILAPHIGNWEVLGKHLPNYGPVINLYAPPKQAYIEEIIKKSREQSGATLVPTTSRGIASLLKQLKKGAITGILPDQCPDTGAGIHAPFFGQPAYTMTLIHGLIQRTGCAVVLGYAKRIHDGFELVFMPVDEGLYSKDQLECVEALNRSVELCVNDCPEQYQWEYKRFKKRAGAANLYQNL